MPNIAALVNQNCNQITTVGFLLGDATLASAKANPDIDFAIVDYAYPTRRPVRTRPKNLQGLIFDTAPPSFMAGYLAAASHPSPASSAPSAACTIPTVTIFMDGFWEGVQYYNKEKKKDVKVRRLGRDHPEGLLHRDFEAKGKAQTVAEGLIQQGADIIFPVAGPPASVLCRPPRRRTPRRSGWTPTAASRPPSTATSCSPR